MLNGHDICHGGLITTLADSAFAFACNSLQRAHRGLGLRRSTCWRRRGWATCSPPPAHEVSQGRPHRRLRLRSQQPARRAHRGVPRPLVHRQGQAARWPELTQTRRRPMPVKHPEPGDLEPIETRQPRRAARRCSCSGCSGRCSTPTTTCRTTAAPSTPQGVHPADLQVAGRPGEVPVHHQGATCATTIPSACSRCRASRWCASTPRRHHRQADGGGLHAARHRHLGRPGGALDPRRRRPRRRHRARGLRLRPVHRRPGRALRRRAAGLHGGADVAAARPRSRCS